MSEPLVTVPGRLEARIVADTNTIELFNPDNDKVLVSLDLDEAIEVVNNLYREIEKLQNDGA